MRRRSMSDSASLSLRFEAAAGVIVATGSGLSAGDWYRVSLLLADSTPPNGLPLEVKPERLLQERIALRGLLDEIGISYFECDSCQALHLPHMQNFDGIFDAKIDLVDNVVLFSALAEVKPSALLALSADLSAINASSLTVKAFIDIQDDNLPKLVVCQSLSIGPGVTMEQFAWFFRQSEEQISMVILEAGANQLLYKGEEEEPAAENVQYHFLH